MVELEAYLKVLDVGYFELQEAFKGLADKNVWKRPAVGLLSVGELAGHIAYWETVRLTCEGAEQVDGLMRPDLAQCRVTSPLVDHRFSYYPTTIPTAPSEQHRVMTADQVLRELMRVHTEAAAHFRAQNPPLESHPPGWPPEYTYGEFLRNLAVHVSYHTGQIYSVRHLLGEQTPDN